MMPITRQGIEILLDSPDRRDYVVSAYADLTVKDGFRTFVDKEFKNQARAAHGALSEADARKALDANLEAVERSIREADASARGLAVFASQARQLHHAVALDFPVRNQLVIDEEPFVLPLLEHWYGEPNYLIAVVDSHHLQLFEAHAGVPEATLGVDRDIPEMQRDKPRFTYKKRFSQARHETLQALDNDEFFKGVARLIADELKKSGGFEGLILLGQAPMTSAVRRLLPKEAEALVVDEAAQAMTDKPDDVADDVARVMEKWRQGREQLLLDELSQRWKENHLVADGATEVLDALQQGRATQVVIGPKRDIAGGRCNDCGYRFGAPVDVCPYCQGDVSSTNAVQEILRMALRHRVRVHLFRRDLETDPLARANGVAALLRAEANWAPDHATARATQGH